MFFDKHLRTYQGNCLGLFFIALLVTSGCPDEAPSGSGAPSIDAGLTFLQNETGSTTLDAGASDAGNTNPEPEPESQCLCPEGYNPTPSDDACKKTITVEATNEGTTYEVCQAQPNFNYGKFGARYPDGTKIQSDYWGRDDGPSNVEGRQNEVGIWPCDANTGQAGFNPTREWIGFSHCIFLDSKSDYIVGIGGDNRVRLKLNGETIFEDVSDNTSAFNYWWMSALEVESGLNIIEMQGYNVSGPASFGAEIAGPFPPDSLGTDQAMIDADYAGNIVWSTGSLVGQSFDVGEDSGWTCPDDYSLNLCTETPECTYIDVVPCEGTDGGL